MVRPETVLGSLDPLSAATAERAIRRCLTDYCRGIDRCDAVLVASVYHPEATDDHGSFVGSGTDFARLATTKLRAYARTTTHFIGEPIIDFVSPTVAEVETPVIAWHRVADAEGEFLENFCGRYFDRFECRDGDWRIADRRLTRDWDTKVRVDQAFPPGTFAPSPRSD